MHHNGQTNNDIRLPHPRARHCNLQLPLIKTTLGWGRKDQGVMMGGGGRKKKQE